MSGKQEDPKLAPCPFCKSEEVWHFPLNQGSPRRTAQCQGCGANAPLEIWKRLSAPVEGPADLRERVAGILWDMVSALYRLPEPENEAESDAVAYGAADKILSLVGAGSGASLGAPAADSRSLNENWIVLEAINRVSLLPIMLEAVKDNPRLSKVVSGELLDVLAKSIRSHFAKKATAEPPDQVPANALGVSMMSMMMGEIGAEFGVYTFQEIIQAIRRLQAIERTARALLPKLFDRFSMEEMADLRIALEASPERAQGGEAGAP